MELTQLSVFIENRHGRILDVTNKLKEANVNLLALSMAETQNFGILRMIVDDPVSAEKTLLAHNMACIQTPVVGIRVDNKVGSLANILKIINDLQLNIEYVYAMSEKITAIIFRFDDPKHALTLLKQHGLDLLTKESLKQ